MEEIKLRDLTDNGFIRFSIKAKDTVENEEVHSQFRTFCKVECDDDYTLGLRTLMNYYSDRGMFEAMWDNLKELEARIVELEVKDKPVEKKEVKLGTF